MKLITVKELSEIIHVKTSTLYAWAERDMIPSHRLNSLLRFDMEEIEAWIRKSDGDKKPVINPKPKSISDNEVDAIIDQAIESVTN